MLSVFALCALFFAAPGQSAHVTPQASQDQEPDEMSSPMMPYESVDVDVDEDADTNGRFQEREVQAHPVLVHPAGPGAKHSRKEHEKDKKVPVGLKKGKDPNPMNTLHLDIQALHNNGIRTLAVDKSETADSSKTAKDSVENLGVKVHHELQEDVENLGVKVNHDPPAPKVKHVAESPEVQPKHQAKPQPKLEQATAPVPRQVPTKMVKAAGAVAAGPNNAPAVPLKALEHALDLPKAPEPEPELESDMEFKPVPVQHKGKKKKHHQDDVRQDDVPIPAKNIVQEKNTAPKAPQMTRHEDLQSQEAGLDVDLQDKGRITPIPLKVEADLEAKLDTEDKHKAAEDASEDTKQPFKASVVHSSKKHGKHKVVVKKEKKESTFANGTFASTADARKEPFARLHDDVHHQTAQSDGAQPARVASSPSEAVAEIKPAEKLSSDIAGDAKVSKDITKSVESKLNKALQPSPKPVAQPWWEVAEPVEEVVEPPRHHGHGKHHKKHHKPQDRAPAWNPNATNGGAMGALHRDAQFRANQSMPQAKLSAEPVKAAVEEVAKPTASPEERLRKDLGIKSERKDLPTASNAPVQAHPLPPVTHNLIHKNHKHKSKKFVVANVTYKDPIAAVHHDAAIVSGKEPTKSSPVVNRTKSVAVKNSTVAPGPVEKLSKAVGVEAQTAKPLGAVLNNLGHALDDVTTLLNGKHKHKKGENKKKDLKKVEAPQPTQPPPYDVKLMRDRKSVV